MVKQWKKSLEQTDIVSDGEAFRGDAVPDTGTIPNTDQVGQGVDWASKTFKLDFSELSNNSLSISGSGYIQMIRFSQLSASDPDVSLSIDGTVLFSGFLNSRNRTIGAFEDNSGNVVATLNTLWRMNNSLTITESGGGNVRAVVVYVLD